MKKAFLGMAACAMLCACSSDDIVSIANQGAAYDGEAVYMTVKIKDVNSGTRATAGDFAYGTETEQKVSTANFYFYDKDGNYIAKGSVNDPNGEATSGTPVDNIEWESDIQVAVWGISDPSVPAKMLTVLNQPSGVDLTNKDFDAAVATLAGTPYDNGENFVMSTSVYYDSSNNKGIVNYTALSEDNFAPEPVNLEEHYGEEEDYTAVEVYVERLAAKVGLSIGIEGVEAASDGTYNVEVTEDMFKDWAKAPESAEGSTYVIQLQGFDVDGVARDAYVVKQIENWTGGSAPFTDWNSVDDHRSYWAESPAYGDEEVTYPAGNWKGNTADEEDTDPLNEYLRYVDLQDPVELGSTTYCGENTNTATVIQAEADSSMNCLTQVLLKAQFGLADENGDFTGVDIVKYHGEYLTLSDFEEDMIAEVERYDFSGMIDDVTEALMNSQLANNDNVRGYLQALCDAVEPVIYCKKTQDGEEYEQFDSRFMQLYSQNDGRVSIWFDTKASQDTEGNSHWNHSDTYGKDRLVPDWYIQTTLVKEATESMDDYDFYVKLNESVGTELSGIMTILQLLGFVTVGDVETEETYFIPLGDKFTVDVDRSSGGDYSYTARNFLIRCIEREAAGIVDDWSESGFPYFYNQGLMYYNVPIEHLASKAATGGTVYPDASGVVEAQYGVVRNHWYNITVTSVDNFGHAIADEEEVIVPQIEEDYYYLGANIDILSWKMVEQSVGF